MHVFHPLTSHGTVVPCTCIHLDKDCHGICIVPIRFGNSFLTFNYKLSMKSTKMQTLGAYNLAGPWLPREGVAPRGLDKRTHIFPHHKKWLTKDTPLRSRTMQEVLDLRNGAISEKTPQFFYLRCPLSTWDASEMGCDLTDRQTEGHSQLQ